MLRIGLFGGTFDPIHRGHLRAARVTEREFALDTVIFIPATVPPHKKGIQLSRATDRLKMLRLALAHEKGFRISLHDLKCRGPAYTVNTVRDFKKLYPRAQLFFIMGSDSLAEFPQWRKCREILRLCQLAVVPRPFFSMPRLPLFIRRRVHVTKAHGLSVSSTHLRHLLSRGKEGSRFLQPSVASYIQQKSLYEPAS